MDHSFYSLPSDFSKTNLSKSDHFSSVIQGYHVTRIRTHECCLEEIIHRIVQSHNKGGNNEF